MLTRVTLRQLRVFAEVARLLSYSGAARALHLTQPAVSLQMKQLEDSAGLPLVERAGRKLYLTEAGRALATATATLLELLRDTAERVEALRGGKAGTLKIGAVSTANYFVPTLLAGFSARLPAARVKLAVGNREEVVKQLADNEIDLAIMGRPPRGFETAAEAFAKHPLGVVAAPAHPLAALRRVPIERLADEQFVIREEGSGTRAAMERVFRDARVPFHALMEFGSNEAVKQAVIAGMGLGFLSLHTVGLELATRRLTLVDVEGMPVIRDWYVIHLRHKRLSPIGAEFLAYLLREASAVIARTTGISPAGRMARLPDRPRRSRQAAPPAANGAIPARRSSRIGSAR
jgi:DNA-binding transcriptional LysR family regulator